MKRRFFFLIIFIPTSFSFAGYEKPSSRTGQFRLWSHKNKWINPLIDTWCTRNDFCWIYNRQSIFCIYISRGENYIYSLSIDKEITMASEWDLPFISQFLIFFCLWYKNCKIKPAKIVDKAIEIILDIIVPGKGAGVSNWYVFI